MAHAIQNQQALLGALCHMANVADYSTRVEVNKAFVQVYGELDDAANLPQGGAECLAFLEGLSFPYGLEDAQQYIAGLTAFPLDNRAGHQSALIILNALQQQAKDAAFTQPLITQYPGLVARTTAKQRIN